MSNFQKYKTVLMAKFIKLYITSPELICLVNESTRTKKRGLYFVEFKI